MMLKNILSILTYGTRPFGFLGSAGSALFGSIAAPVIGQLLGSGNQGGQQAAATAADPYASQRAQWQPQLASLMGQGAVGQGQQFNYSTTGPNANPAYLNSLQTGIDTVNRGAYATGRGGSGANMAQLQQTGANMANANYNSQFAQYQAQQQLNQQQFQNQYTNLAQLSGASVGNPGQAGQILGNAATAQSAGLAQIGNNIGTALGNTNFGSATTTDGSPIIDTSAGSNFLGANYNTPIQASSTYGSVSPAYTMGSSGFNSAGYIGGSTAGNLGGFSSLIGTPGAFGSDL
jgi:hypothetical protein